MDMALQTKIEQCAPAMNHALMAALVRRESNGNPFAIGMDGKDTLEPQPKNLSDAITSAEKLAKQGKSFSVGLAQIHISNIRLLGLPWAQAFDACISLRRGQQIYEQFYAKAIGAGFKKNDAIFAALRGYNSGSVFAPISNNYAAAIMADAAQAVVPTLRVIPPTVMPVFVPESEQDRKSESLELFSK
jgi:type IV secretion system protein VirB1